MLEVVDVKKSYQRNQMVLKGVTFNVRSGETVGLIGPNGAGKTTMMGCLLGLQHPDSGVIRIEGKAPDDNKIRQITGYMPERLNFEPWLTGREFITYHHQLAKRPKSTRSTEVAEKLHAVGLDESSWSRPIRTYSRGMLQRLGLAQALIGNPRLLFLDEPTSGIDPVGALEILRTIRALREQHVTIIINSHQLDQLERICDRAVLLRAGQIEKIEDLRTLSESRYSLLIRWLPAQNGNGSNGGEPHQPQWHTQNLTELAVQASCQLLAVRDNEAVFSVPGDEGAATLLRMLVSAGLYVYQSKPDSRLERLLVPNHLSQVV